MRAAITNSIQEQTKQILEELLSNYRRGNLIQWQ